MSDPETKGDGSHGDGEEGDHSEVSALSHDSASHGESARRSQKSSLRLHRHFSAARKSMTARRVAVSANRTRLDSYRRTSTAFRLLLWRLEKERCDDPVVLKQRAWLRAALPFLDWDFVSRFERHTAEVWPSERAPPHTIVDALRKPDMAIFLFLLVKNFLLHRLQPLHNDYVQELFEPKTRIEEKQEAANKNGESESGSSKSESEDEDKEMEELLLYGTSSRDQMSRLTQRLDEDIRKCYTQDRAKKSKLDTSKQSHPANMDKEPHEGGVGVDEGEGELWSDAYSVSSEDFPEQSQRRRGLLEDCPTESRLEELNLPLLKRSSLSQKQRQTEQLKEESMESNDENKSEAREEAKDEYVISLMSADESDAQKRSRVSAPSYLSSVVEVTSESDAKSRIPQKHTKRPNRKTRKVRRPIVAGEISGVEELVSDVVND